MSYGNNNHTIFPGGVAVGESITQDNPPKACAAFEVSSITKGILFPRMTTAQRGGITPVNGLVVYDSNNNVLMLYAGNNWLTITAA